MESTNSSISDITEIDGSILEGGG